MLIYYPLKTGQFANSKHKAHFSLSHQTSVFFSYCSQVSDVTAIMLPTKEMKEKTEKVSPTKA